WRFFFVVGVIFEVGSQFRKQLGGNFGAARKTAELRVLSFGSKGVLRAGGVGGTGFSREANSDFGGGCGIFGAIGPAIGGAFTGDFDGLEYDRWIVGAVEALGTFLADADTPAGFGGGGCGSRERLVRGAAARPGRERGAGG